MRMRSVTVHEAKAHLSALLAAVEAGEEVIVTRYGRPVARVVPIAVPVQRVPGDWRKLPGWQDFVYDPAIFAPMTAEEATAEGWDG